MIPLPRRKRPDDDPDWRTAIDERLIRRVEQHQRDGERLVFEPRLRVYLDPPRSHVTPEDWGAGYLQDPHEYDIPIQLQDDLRQSAPQSLLRDLYRPVHDLRWHQRETIEGTGYDPLGGIDEARAARRFDRVAPYVEPAVRTVIAYLYWRIGMVSERWEPTLPDDAPRKRSFGIPGQY